MDPQGLVTVHQAAKTGSPGVAFLQPAEASSTGVNLVLKAAPRSVRGALSNLFQAAGGQDAVCVQEDQNIPGCHCRSLGQLLPAARRRLDDLATQFPRDRGRAVGAATVANDNLIRVVVPRRGHGLSYTVTLVKRWNNDGDLHDRFQVFGRIQTNSQ